MGARLPTGATIVASTVVVFVSPLCPLSPDRELSCLET
jgi:hypothetical protein